MTLPCIVCGKELESAFPEGCFGDDSNQPLHGLAFSSIGNYGSTIFDPGLGGHQKIELSLCDECAQEKGAAGVIRYREVHTYEHTTWITKPWPPPDY